MAASRAASAVLLAVLCCAGTTAFKSAAAVQDSATVDAWPKETKLEQLEGMCE
jgi:hypothetical protein